MKSRYWGCWILRLLEYYPAYLRELYELQTLTEAEQPEFDRLSAAVAGLAQEFSLMTASEYGVGRLEKIYGVRPEAGMTLEARRAAVLARMLIMLPYTLRRLREAACNIAGETIGVSVDYGAYAISLIRQQDGFSFPQSGALGALIERMKPANMTCTLQSGKQLPVDCHIGMGLMMGKIYTIGEAV